MHYFTCVNYILKYYDKKLRKIEHMGHVLRIWKWEMHPKFYTENLKGRVHGRST